ncbi:hypothetical protein EV121DRAFT_216875 [Schizophyllum commune]
MSLLGENLRPRTLLRKLSNVGRRSRSRASAVDEVHPFRLLDLPPEIVEVILSLSRPMDVLALRMTCTALNITSRDRQTWLVIAQRTAFEHDVPLGPKKRIAMSISDLERFATAPARSLRALSAASGRYCLGADAKQIPKLRARRETIHKGIGPEHSFYGELYILPGGQYMINVDEDANMTFWRLDSASPIKLGSIPFQPRAQPEGSRINRFHKLCTHQLLRDGTILRIVTCMGNIRETESVKESVYDISLEGVEIGPRLIASTYVPLRSGSLFPNVVSFFGTRVAVVDKDDIIVWDFAHDLQTSWPHLFGHIHDWRVLMYDNRVIVVGCPADPEERFKRERGQEVEKYSVRAKISVFEIPVDAVGPIQLLPGLSLCLGHDQFLHLPCRAVTGVPFSFQVRTCQPEADDLLHTYSLRQDLESTRRSSEYLTVAPEPSADECLAETSATTTVLCDVGHALIQTGYPFESDSRYKKIHLAWPEHINGRRLLRGSVRLAHGSKSRMRAQAFDPVSGRLCALRSDGGLLVADYI